MTKGVERLIKSGMSKKSFSSLEDAENYYFLYINFLDNKIKDICQKYNLILDYSLNSIKAIEKLYFDFYEKNEFAQINISRDEFGKMLGIYWGKCAINYNSEYTWKVKEDWFVKGKYQLYLEDKKGNLISYKIFCNLYEYPNNKTKTRMYREFKKMIMSH